MKLRKKSVSIMELLISLALLGVLILSFTSIDLFGRFQIRNADRKAKAQNGAYTAVEHMIREIGRGAGNSATAPVLIFGNDRIKIRMDRNPADGIPDDTGGNDFIAYRYRASNDQIYFWPSSNSASGFPTWGTAEIVGTNIIACTFSYNANDNFVSIDLTACWDPGGAAACGTQDNPSVTLRNNIRMPAVSTN